jgi:imidazolonepropionase-like amidohydrolase
MTRRLVLLCALVLVVAWVVRPDAQTQNQPLERGPFKRLVIRGANIVDGTGGPPYGPADVVIENNRITSIDIVGHPLGDINESARPPKGDHEIDARGMYLLPGLIDSHVHIPRAATTGLPDEYYWYLNLAHGITAVVDVVGGYGLPGNVAFNKRVENNEVVAPRVIPFARLSVDGRAVGYDFPGVVNTPERGREWVRAVAKEGAVGLKLRGNPPKITAAILDEAKALGLKTTMHLEQRGVGQMNIVDAAQMGLGRQDHWYGIAEAMLTEQSIPHWDPDYIYNNEQDRWRDAGRTWHQAVSVGSPEWNNVMEELLSLDFTIAPTMHFYDYLRDAQARRTAEYHAEYSTPELLTHWEPKIGNHPGILDWGTEEEMNWYHFMYKWQQFLKEYNRRGGRIVVGSDAGSGYGLYGFALIREMELLQQAGLNTTEIIRSATLYAAEYLGIDDDFGTVQVGKTADLLLVQGNPLDNLKVLYANGHLRYNPQSKRVERVGGVRHTIRNGVVIDAALVRDRIKQMVRQAKSKATTTTN